MRSRKGEKEWKDQGYQKIKEFPVDDALASSLGACQVSEVRVKAPGVWGGSVEEREYSARAVGGEFFFSPLDIAESMEDQVFPFMSDGGLEW